nr:MAG TPA: hypothetical protein [Caudoviricetes sp.]
MSESFLSKIREESVQARTQMYDLLSMLRRRGVTSGIIKIGMGRCAVMFYDGSPDIYRYVLDKYTEESLYNVYYIEGLNIGSMDFIETNNKYVFRFTDKGIFTDRVNTVRYTKPFDISELLFELKFEGMK